MNVNREAVFGYVKENYGTEPEFLWASTPDAAVLRNRRNKKMVRSCNERTKK